MAATPERKVKDAVIAVLKAYGAYHFYPPGNGFGRAGIPDIIVCFHGHFIAIECKAGKRRATKLQERELDRIELAGGIAIVAREHNIDKVTEVLQYMRDRYA